MRREAERVERRRRADEVVVAMLAVDGVQFNVM